MLYLIILFEDSNSGSICTRLYLSVDFALFDVCLLIANISFTLPGLGCNCDIGDTRRRPGVDRPTRIYLRIGSCRSTLKPAVGSVSIVGVAGVVVVVRSGILHRRQPLIGADLERLSVQGNVDATCDDHETLI